MRAVLAVLLALGASDVLAASALPTRPVLKRFSGELLESARDFSRRRSSPVVDVSAVVYALNAMPWQIRDDELAQSYIFSFGEEDVEVLYAEAAASSSPSRLPEDPAGLDPGARGKLSQVLAALDLALHRGASLLFPDSRGSGVALAGALERRLRSAERFKAIQNEFFGPRADRPWDMAWVLSRTVLSRRAAVSRRGLRDAGHAGTRSLLESLSPAPLDAEALEHLLLEALPDMLQRVWRTANARTRDGRMMISDIEMAEAIEITFPYRDGPPGRVILFPDSPRPFQADAGAAREAEAVGWELLDDFLREGAEPETDHPVDAFAAEQLAELLGVLSAAILRRASTDAEERGRVGTVGLLRTLARIEELSRGGPSPKDRRPAPQAAFEDWTSTSGIFMSRLSTRRTDGPTWTMAPRGAAVLDFDRDGLPDVFLCDVGEGAKLYRNLGGFRFQDQTRKRGLEGIFCFGASSADYDNDGLPDLLALASDKTHPNRLFRNAGERFVESSGLPRLDRACSVSSAWLDYDRDGWLDLYVVNYGGFRGGGMRGAGFAANGSPNALFRNNRDGTFTELGRKAGAADRGWGLAGAAFDYDGDGWTDLYSVNDFGFSVLLRNRGDGTFEDLSIAAGVHALGAGMGASPADFDGDGDPDLYVTVVGPHRLRGGYLRPDGAARVRAHAKADNIQFRIGNRLFVNRGDGTFREAHDALVGDVPTGWGWNGWFFDFDNDADQDLYIMNGWSPNDPYYHDEANVLLAYDAAKGRFRDISGTSGADRRGHDWSGVTADFDRDGCVDIIVTGLEAPAAFRNACRRSKSRHWLSVRLRGGRSNRDGIGAKITVIAAGRRRTAEHGTQGGGFASSPARESHFGLGESGGPVRVEVVWPSGKRQVLKSVAVDRVVEIEEP